LHAPDRIVRTLYGLVALTGLTLHASRARRAARHPADPEGPFVRNRLSLLPLLLTLLVGLSVPATAGADYKRVYKDCSDGTVDGTYTAKELKQALDNQEANTGDYSECSDAIFRAQQALGKGDGSTGAGGSGAAGGGTTGSGTTGSGGGTTAGGAGTPSTGDVTNGGSGSTGGTDGGTTDPSASVPATDARNADLAEKQAALVAATRAAEREAGARAADLKDAAVPAAALELGASNTTLPLPLLLTLVACVVAACIAGGTSGLQALRRRRGR
jgi:hypothetical protein